MTAERSKCTCSKSSREACSLGQVVVLHVKLKICLFSEVPGASCAAKQLLFIAVFDCQVHLGGEAIRWTI